MYYSFFLCNAAFMPFGGEKIFCHRYTEFSFAMVRVSRTFSFCLASWRLCGKISLATDSQHLLLTLDQTPPGMSPHNLNRFLEAQQNTYQTALAEIKNGRKQSHWIWYIFPQIAGLGLSQFSKLYGIRDLQEAEAYLDHPILGARLIEISNALLLLNNKTAHEIFGSPDDLKTRSCMTLFNAVENANPVFKAVLDKYYEGKVDKRTLELLGASDRYADDTD